MSEDLQRQSATEAEMTRAPSRPADQVPDMVERVARALCEDNGDDPDDLDNSRICKADGTPLPLWAAYESAAIAALQAVPQVADTVEAVARIIDAYKPLGMPQLLPPDSHEAGLKRAAATLAALQAVPASGEVGEVRELLVEAQRYVADLAALPCEAVGPENAESCSCDPCRARSLNERIDFALKASKGTGE